MCGIYGIYNLKKKKDILNELIDGLKKLQHRGKDSYGYSYTNERDILKINTVKNIGLVEDQYHDLNTKINSCIGHVRYSTSGKSKDNNTVSMKEVQPLTHRFKDSQSSDLSIVHNGNIPSIKGHDTTKLLTLIIGEKDKKINIEESLCNVMNTISGSYCLIIQYNNSLYVMKDRFGIRPLSYGIKDGNIHISSETNALSGCNITEVKSGEILKWNGDIKPIQLYQHKEVYNYVCAFELIYFMNPESYHYNVKVEDFRKYLARTLSKKETLKGNDYIVVGAPTSGIIYGQEYASQMNLKYEQLILKTDECTNGSDRTFTIIDNNDRIKACKKKFKYDKEKIKGKKIIIMDDTIVRGNVIKQLIEDLWECEASEIHIRIPAPPVVDICQLGIAIHKKEELLMNNKRVEEVTDILNVNSIVYNSLSDLGENMYKQCFGGGIHKELI